MRRSRKRLLLALLMASGLSPACHKALPPASTPGVDVRHYDLTLRLDPPAHMLYARAVLHATRPGTLATLPLAFDGMTLDTVRVDEHIVEVERTRSHLLVPLPPNHTASRLEIVYHGQPTRGVRAATHDGQHVLFTDSWPDDGSGWLPGVHHPSDPATLALQLTLPRGYEAVASGALQALDTLGATVRYRWRLNVPVPTYAFAWAVADFSVSKTAMGDTLPVWYYVLAEDSSRTDLLTRTPQALRFFNALLGPYPFAQYAAVQVPMRYAGMENASAAFLNADLFHDGTAEAVQVHELAHQWFGNRVPLAAWRDLWLSEGTATYLTTLFYEDADGRDAVRRRWTDLATLTPQRQRTHTALVPPVPASPEDLLTWVPYDKGACVLHLLRRTLGDEAFFNALRTIYRRHAGHPLSTADMQTILEETTGRDLDALFDYWVYDDALPTLRTAWAPATRTLAWQIEDDAGTLAGVPFELEVRQGERIRYVEAGVGHATLVGWSDILPDVRPVGVMMQVER